MKLKAICFDQVAQEVKKASDVAITDAFEDISILYKRTYKLGEYYDGKKWQEIINVLDSVGDKRKIRYSGAISTKDIWVNRDECVIYNDPAKEKLEVEAKYKEDK